jgi:HlyD family secretion protein
VPDPAEARLGAGQELVGMDTEAAARALDADKAALDLAGTAIDRAQGALHERRCGSTASKACGAARAGGCLAQRDGSRPRRCGPRRGRSRLRADRRQAAQSLVDHDHAAMAGAVARAPFAGYLIGCRVAPGQAIRAGQPLCTIAAHPES